MSSGWHNLWNPSNRVTPGASDPAWWNEKAQAASDVVRGAMPFAAPLMAPAAAAAPIPAAIGLAAGIGGGAAGEAVGRAAGMPSGVAALTGDIAGFGAGALAPHVVPAMASAVPGVARGLADTAQTAGQGFDWITNRINQGLGYDPANPDLNPERGSVKLWTPGTKLADVTPDIVVPRAGANLKKTDVMHYLEAQVQNRFGALPPNASPEQKLQRILQVARPELEDQMNQAEPNLDFYTRDTAKSDSNMARVYPELRTDPVKHTVQKAISAGLSPSSNPRQEGYYGAKVYEGYRPEEQLPIKQPSGLNWPSQGAQKFLTKLQSYIDEYGEPGVAEILKSNWSRKFLRTINPNIAGKADDIAPGSLILGPKVGRYFNDIMGIPQEGSTVDMWATQANHRAYGNMFNQAGKPIEVPPTEGDRWAAMKADEILAKEYGLPKTNMAQSGRWFYEQNLYRRLGLPVKSFMRSEGTQRFLEEHGSPGVDYFSLDPQAHDFLRGAWERNIHRP
jgi:hypothetical protein